jgi:aspartyl-tRNA(Asn)/glutamyl-tRNA(Gln) amidotransferase subunit C
MAKKKVAKKEKKVSRKAGEKQKIQRKKSKKLSVPIAKAKKQIISLETVEKVAKIARLNLTEDEKTKFQKDLNEILSAFKILDEAKTEEKPSFQPYEIKDVLRDDREEETLGQRALENTRHKEKGFIKGPRVV